MQVHGDSKRAKRGSWALWASGEQAMGFQEQSGPAVLHTRAQVPRVQARRGVQVSARIAENGPTAPQGVQVNINPTRANPTVVATPLWLSSTQQVTMVHIIIGSNTSCKGVIAKQLMDVMGLNPSSANRRLLQLKDQGLGYKVFSDRHVLSQLQQLGLASPLTHQPWSSWVQRQLVPHYTSLNQALSKLGTHRRAVLQTQALVSPVEQPHAEVVLQWQEQFKDIALQELSKHQAWEALPVEVAHLTSSRGVTGVVLTLTDPKELQLLHAYETRARPVLLQPQLCEGDGQQLVQTLYLNSQGLPYSVENLAKWWKRLHTVTKATWSFVPLHELRNVFITHRLDHPEVPGPSTEASAHVMLNSPTTWHAHYDRNKKQRLALEAQANMPLYRQALLQGGAGKSKGPAQQKSWGEEGGAAYDDEA
ncbi:hypothetical protein V8C86DRAFT_3025262 [Haematococcus lacustris]